MEPDLSILDTRDTEPPDINNLTTQSSIFSGGGCGELCLAQNVVFDFTPNEEDNAYTMNKCCDFWEAVGGCAELKKLKVLPEKQSVNKSRISQDISKPLVHKTVKSEVEGRSALSMLEIVEGKGLINRVFETKMPQSSCAVSDREYLDHCIIERRQSLRPMKKPASTKLKGKSSKADTLTNSPKIDSADEVTKLKKVMYEWDAKHPKSMEPPGHSPALTHCVLQR
ncbi:uncharacterized protein LOC114244602 [Bombyx mandarina]|uniref:Uncharacterized protein LOC114244602 n=1 Tax=Bombyx mandarina TaxID=7092 RepID=A0A6J2JR97_BOMMA|nr:uncharacterized protein LOC114244602 [Bombyx mandarina]